jgi:hypothetical protein
VNGGEAGNVGVVDEPYPVGVGQGQLVRSHSIDGRAGPRSSHLWRPLVIPLDASTVGRPLARGATLDPIPQVGESAPSARRASSANSSRRSPGTRRRPLTRWPTSSGRTSSRRARRESPSAVPSAIHQPYADPRPHPAMYPTPRTVCLPGLGVPRPTADAAGRREAMKPQPTTPQRLLWAIADSVTAPWTADKP